MKIAVIGSGNMGGAIACALAASGRFGRGEIVCSNRSARKAELLHERYDVITATTNNLLAATDAEMVIFAVKPYLMEEVMREVALAMKKSCRIVVSVAAGVSLEQLSGWFKNNCGHDAAIVRVIPNTAISVGRSMTFMSVANADAEQTAMVKDLFDMMGSTMIVDEKMLETGMILASCGIAYALRYLRAATEGGVELGCPASQASEIVARTMIGAAELLLQHGTHPEQEIDRVTTAGGITIRGLNEMEHAGFSSAVIRGLKACKK